QYNIVLNSLILLKAYTRLSLINSTTDLNTDFETTHKALLESYSLQNQSLENTNVEQKKKFSYSQDDLKKINELLSQPLILNSTNQDKEFKNKPNTLRSQTYLEFCSSYPEFKKGDITISKNKKIELNSEYDDYTFNLQNIAYRKGIDPSCELIDILGNLKEKKYNQIEFVTFENKIKDFDIVIDYLMKKIPFDSKEK
ncbi:hypothetical protein, partial [Acinetobacter seifertii]|uniref:hypothetical protein n=1 Tax=Acinetobacter seifertii TaxID=1530123 RepID=UPI00148A0D7E